MIILTKVIRPVDYKIEKIVYVDYTSMVIEVDPGVYEEVDLGQSFDTTVVDLDDNFIVIDDYTVVNKAYVRCIIPSLSPNTNKVIMATGKSLATNMGKWEFERRMDERNNQKKS